MTDVAIVGGGLAGLLLAILLAQKNHSVALIESGTYPRHKVCGEYISLESFNFIERLGIPLGKLDLPNISKLIISDQKGKLLNADLDLGGFGMSRFLLEQELFSVCEELGVKLHTETDFKSFKKIGDHFQIETSKGPRVSKVLCAAFGKYAPRSFYKSKATTENWVGVKHHIEYDHPTNEIVLHNFNGGYCGMSKIENDRSCLCYLVKSSVLKKAGGVNALEANILRSNPLLNEVFEKAKFIFEKPLTISNVTFSVKKPTYEQVFYLGDAAGTIAPLSGNGMSNAFRSAHLLQPLLSQLLHGELNFQECLTAYESQWQRIFAGRIGRGRLIQRFFSKPSITQTSLSLLKAIPIVHRKIIGSTHGKPF